MTTTRVTQRIQAPVDQVFRAIAEPARFCEIQPHITNVEFLSEEQTGVGTRFRETRDMDGRVATTELEITEWVDNERVRLVSDQGGTVWDSLFTVREAAGETELELVMEARAHKLAARLINPFIKGMIAKAIRKDFDQIKEYCER